MDFRPNIHPDDVKSVGESIASLCPEQPVETHENRAILSSGEVRWLQWTNRGIFDDTGRLIEVQAVGRDVTERKRAEEARRKAADELSLILGAVTEHVLLHNPSMQIVWASRAAAESVDATPEQLKGRHCYEVWPQRQTPCEGCPVRAALQTGKPQRREMTTPDGRVWDVRGYPVYEDDGTLAGAVEVTLDITEHKRAEDALRLAQASINAVSDSIFWIAPDGRFMYVNDAACRTLGYTRDELLGMRVADMDPDYTHEKRAAQWERVKRGGVLTFESHHRTREGRVFPVEVTSNYLRFGDHEYEFGFARDITERKRAEEALRESEANYRAIFNAVNEVLFVHDIETGDVVDFNPRASEVYGYRPEEIGLLNAQFHEGAEPPYSHEDQMRWLGRAAEGGPQMFEWLATDRSGRRFWVEVSLKRTTIGGRDRLLAVLRDIEDRKRAGEASAGPKRTTASCLRRASTASSWLPAVASPAPTRPSPTSTAWT